MKANEAPETIYRTTTYLDNDKGKTVWKNAPVAGAENIKYTRTDAFIEKAAEWILRNGSYYIAFEQGQPCIDKEFVEEFKNAMKNIKASE